jgi:outer membrane protein assembly factor BamB
MSMMHTIYLAAILAVGAPAPNGPLAGTWPQWRGPERTGVSTETGLLKEWPAAGPPLLWKVPGIGQGYASVAIAGGRLYTVGDRAGAEYVFCLDAATGKSLWSTVIRKPGNGARSTPTVDGDLLYALSTRDQQEADLVCLETATGKERWRRSFRNDFHGRMMTSWGYSESPLVDGERVVCTPGGAEATLVALDKKTGALIWKSQVPGGDAAGYSSIVVAETGGVRQYIQMLERGIVGVAAKDGKFLWRYNRVANGTANIPTAIVKGDLVFCSTGYNTGAALLQLVPARDGSMTVKEKYFLPANKFQNHHGGMVLVGDHIYAGHGHNNGIPTCIEMETGKIVWRQDRGPGTGSAAVVYADGRLYFRYDNAVMALIEATPEGYHLKGQFKIPGGATPSWQHPVIADGRLYLRDQDKIYCYNVKAQ